MQYMEAFAWFKNTHEARELFNKIAANLPGFDIAYDCAFCLIKSTYASSVLIFVDSPLPEDESREIAAKLKDFFTRIDAPRWESQDSAYFGKFVNINNLSSAIIQSEHIQIEIDGGPIIKQGKVIRSGGDVSGDYRTLPALNALEKTYVPAVGSISQSPPPLKEAGKPSAQEGQPSQVPILVQKKTGCWVWPVTILGGLLVIWGLCFGSISLYVQISGTASTGQTIESYVIGLSCLALLPFIIGAVMLGIGISTLIKIRKQPPKIEQSASRETQNKLKTATLGQVTTLPDPMKQNTLEPSTGGKPEIKFNKLLQELKFHSSDAIQYEVEIKQVERGNPAMEMLGALGGRSNVEDPLADKRKRLKQAREKDAEIRAIAAKRLGELGDTRAIEHLISALEDRFSSVRMNACNALGQLGDKKATIQLSKLLESDPDQSVRDAARSALDLLTSG